MGKATILFVVFTSCLITRGYSQTYELDSVKVTFSKDRDTRIVNSQRDLFYSISVKNISKKPVLVYDEIVNGLDSSFFENFYYDLYKKEAEYQKLESNLGYGNNSDLFWEYEQKFGRIGADSAIVHFDCPKRLLLPGESIVYKYNILELRLYFEKGTYRFKSYFRVASHYHKDDRGTEVVRLEYRESAWYYFTIGHTLQKKYHKSPWHNKSR